MNISLSKLWIDKNEFNQVKEVLSSGWLTKGPKNKELEKMVEEYLGVKHAICVSSGTSALHLAVIALELLDSAVEKYEVLVADYTFPATGNMVIASGFKPVFVDIDPKTYNIDYKDLKKKFNKKKTRAIIVVHTFGQAAEMDKIMKLANKWNVPVIEDAACALGGKYKGQYCGTIGKIGCFSLHATKTIGTGEGGLITTNDDKIAEVIRLLADHGKTKTPNGMIDFPIVAYNYKLSDLQAAVGIAQFQKIDKIIKKKNNLAKYWNKKLKEIDYIKSPYFKKGKGNRHTYQGYCCLVTPVVDRNKLISILKERGIECQIGTYSSHILYAYNNQDDNCVNSKDVFNRAIRFPLYYKLKRSDIDSIIEILKEIRDQVFI